MKTSPFFFDPGVLSFGCGCGVYNKSSRVGLFFFEEGRVNKKKTKALEGGVFSASLFEGCRADRRKKKVL